MHRVLVFCCVFLFLFSEPIIQASERTELCTGKAFTGPWYKVSIPENMVLDAKDRSQAVTGKSDDYLWVETLTDTKKKISFFLFSPQHGGIPFLAYENAERVVDLVRFENDDGYDMRFMVFYRDGSVGYFEGNSQLVTGFKTKGGPLNKKDYHNFICFRGSIEQFGD